jgi:hypothetical protein
MCFRSAAAALEMGARFMSKQLVAVAAMVFVATCNQAIASPVTPREVREGKVTACSSVRYDCYTAKLVKSKVGWMVRLKGGNLLHCGVTCQDTLRRSTVDFWEDLRERSR